MGESAAAPLVDTVLSRGKKRLTVAELYAEAATVTPQG
jgi:hypothetical protein